ncbi:MAG: HEPN domain-containing protein [Nitrospirae bacterium]|nr:HEPN domain-containing protein [Nitrospirota bacterium]MBI3351483.1 HEPN domain-containing protein [Nitrospirota bacterium]
MSFQKDLHYSDDWRRVARQDWHRRSVMLEDGDAEGAGFFLQQAIEKYLKAFLLEKGWKLKKIHTLHSLIDEASEFDNTLTRFRPLCERISGYYFSERYPSLGGAGLETKDVRQELSESRALIRVLFPGETLE